MKNQLTTIYCDSVLPKVLCACALAVLILGGHSSYAADDITAPVLHSVTIDKTSVDVSSGPQSITFTFDVSDESALSPRSDAVFIGMNTPGGTGYAINSFVGDGRIQKYKSIARLTFLGHI